MNVIAAASSSESVNSVENEESASCSDSEINGDDDEEDVPKLADKEYKDMPFEDLLKLQKKLGSRVYNEAIFGKSIEKRKTTESNKSIKKAKNDSSPSGASSESEDDSGPEETTSKRKVPALGMTKKSKHPSNQRARDPRFDPRQGYFSGRQFRSNFSFINDLREQELTTLKNKLAASTDPEEADKIKFVMKRTANQMREYAKQKQLDQERIREKREVRQAVGEGKRPFFERKSTKQARALVEQYDKLKSDGQLEKHIDKRRKKILAKDRKKLDFST